TGCHPGHLRRGRLLPAQIGIRNQATHTKTVHEWGRGGGNRRRNILPGHTLSRPTKNPRTFRVQPTPQHRNDRNRRRRRDNRRERGFAQRTHKGSVFLLSAMKSPREDRYVMPKARDFSLEGEGFLDGTGQNYRRPQAGGGRRGGSSLSHSNREEARRSDEKRP